MTDREKMIETLAATLWKVQSIDAGTPESVALGRTPEAFANEHALTRKQFTKYAAAALDLCGPKPLVWVYPSDGSAHDEDCRYEVTMWGNMSWWRLTRGVTGGGSYSGDFKDLESAQAAAQSHADAAHWGNTKIGDLIGGK
jgi:hypothetical protein